MARDRSTTSPSSSDLSDTLKKQSLQLPAHIVDAFKDDAKHRGPSSIRYAGTLAIAIWMSLPKEVRDEMYDHITRAHWAERRNLTIDEISEAFKKATLTTEITETVRRLDRSHEIELRLNPSKQTHAASA